MFTADPWPLLLGGLLAGLVFGFLLQKGQVARYAVIVGQFLLADFTMARIMGTAILVGGIGVYAMLALGWIDGLLIKPAYLVGVGLGGLVFGVGMTTLGYCPGTVVAAVASGSRHGLFGLVGAIVGAALYTEVYPLIDDSLLRVADYGKVTLPEVLHVQPWLVFFFVGALAVAASVVLDRRERRMSAEVP
jgi:uncharacterized membrane protein YedE/YeeE